MTIINMTFMLCDSYAIWQLCDMTFMQYGSYAIWQLCNMTVMQCVSYAMSQLCKTTCLLLLNLIIYHIPASLSPATTGLCPGLDRSMLPMGWQHTTSAGNNKQGANINWRHGQLYWRYPQNWRFSQNWRSPKRSPKILAILRKSQKYWRFC